MVVHQTRKKIEESLLDLQSKFESQELKIKELNLVIEELSDDVDGLIKKEQLDEEDIGCDDELSEEEVENQIKKEDELNKEKVEEENVIPAPRPDNDFSEVKPLEEISPKELDKNVTSQ